MSTPNLTSEQQEKLQACHSPEEIFALAQSEGYELSDDDLEQIAGGGGLWGDLESFLAAKDITQLYANDSSKKHKSQH